MRILITGGAGYIGGHALFEALNAGHEAHVVDNLCNSSVESLARVKQLTNRDFGFTRADIRDGAAMRDVVNDFAPEAVIHFAGLKAVGASVSEPLAYFDNNVAGTLALLGALRDSECRRFVFSSSATVYGDPDYLPIDEAHPLRTTNPYGRTKLQIEGILQDLAASDPAWSIALLRYFNPVGAHPSGRIGEDPVGVPNNLMPFVAQVAVGRRDALGVYGDDYDTPDGTGVRDYIHVTDLARAHLAAIDWSARARGCEAFNLGNRKRRLRARDGRARFPRPAGVRSRSGSRPGARETWRPVSRTRGRRRPSSAGARNSGWRRCAGARGIGSRRIRTVTVRTESIRGRGSSPEREPDFPRPADTRGLPPSSGPIDQDPGLVEREEYLLIFSPGPHPVPAETLALFLALDILQDGLPHHPMCRAVSNLGQLLDPGTDVRIKLDGDGTDGSDGGTCGIKR